MQNNIINELKSLIKEDNLSELRLYYYEIINNSFDYSLNLQYIYKEILLYTCYEGSEQMLEYMLDLYDLFDDISKIALRQIFFYCKYILIKQDKNTQIIENFLNKIRYPR